MATPMDTSTPMPIKLSSLSSLPAELLLEIISHLDFGDKYSLHAVSRVFHRILGPVQEFSTTPPSWSMQFIGGGSPKSNQALVAARLRHAQDSNLQDKKGDSRFSVCIGCARLLEKREFWRKIEFPHPASSPAPSSAPRKNWLGMLCWSTARCSKDDNHNRRDKAEHVRAGLHSGDYRLRYCMDCPFLAKRHELSPMVRNRKDDLSVFFPRA